MPESEFDRRVRQISDRMYQRMVKDHHDNELHRIIEERPPSEFEDLCRKYHPGGVGQAEWPKIVERLREDARQASRSD